MRYNSRPVTKTITLKYSSGTLPASAHKLMPLLVLVLALFLMLVLSACGEDSDIAAQLQRLYGKNQKITGDYDRASPGLNNGDKNTTSRYNKALAVKCSNGIFLGRADHSDDGVVSFKGIPYAEQPTGRLRWKPPVPVKDSSSLFEAYYYGHSPIQTTAASEVGSYYPQGEDCLNLNIWTNSRNDSENKPVMVFFHGGSYGWGATSDPMYDGHNLIAKFDDIILVTVEYRTGMMGFIDFSTVKGGDKYAESGNLGLLDQKCALEWVQKNITAFGGDPENVTIFGESAGGGSVSLLPLMEGTKGLFRRIIAQSGSVALTFSKMECQPLTEMLLEETGAKSMDDLIKLPESKIMELNEDLNDYNNFPERDGIILPVDLYGLYRSGKTKDYPMLQGTNADEFRYFIKEVGEVAPLIADVSVFEHVIPILYENNYKTLPAVEKDHADRFMSIQRDEKVWNITEFYNELLFRIPAMKQAEYQAACGGDSYVYYWTYPSADKTIGACHAVELSYVFNNLQDTIYTGNNVDEKLADTVQNMWVNFARNGDPSTGKYKWEQYKPDTRKTMVLGKDIHMEKDIKSAQRREIEPILHHYFNGGHNMLDFDVPQIYKIAAQLFATLTIIIGSIVLIVILRHKRRKRSIEH